MTKHMDAGWFKKQAQQAEQAVNQWPEWMKSSYVPTKKELEADGEYEMEPTHYGAFRAGAEAAPSHPDYET